MLLPNLFVVSQRVARLVSNVRASTRTAHSVDIRSVLCGRWASTRDHRATSPLSLQARSFLSPGRGLIDLLLRAWASTATLQIRLVWCARSASKGDQQPLRPRFLVCAFGEQRKHLAYPFAPSKLACILYMDGKVDQSKRARVYEHRVPTNTIVPVCAFREHKD